MGDLYEVLGAAPSSEDVVIKAAYNALIRKYHPDVFKGDKVYAEKKTKEINAAYDILRDPAKRATYDAERSTRRQSEKKEASGKAPDSPPGTVNNQNETRQKQPAYGSVPEEGGQSGSIALALIVIFVLMLVGAAFIGQISNLSKEVHSNDMSPPADLQKPTTSLAPPEVRSFPTKIDWKASDGDPSAYDVQDYRIALSSAKDGQGNKVAVLDADLRKLPHLHFSASVGGETSASSLGILKLDPKSSDANLLFATYSGGAHCCTTIDIFEPVERGWKHLSISGDGVSLEKLPDDIDGDGVPDIVVLDDRFLYVFDSYAGSDPPPLVYNLVDGRLVEVSASARYRNYYRNKLTAEQAGCLLHKNGACAAFVAIASRINLHDWAWKIAEANYNPSSQWSFPKKCDLDTNGLPCPADHQAPSTFTEALAKLLIDSGYYDPSVATTDDGQPSFDCAGVHNEVLQLICSRPALAAADRTLAAAYYAATIDNPQAKDIKTDQVNWIRVRNEQSINADVIQRLYEQRIAYLLGLVKRQPSFDQSPDWNKLLSLSPYAK